MPSLPALLQILKRLRPLEYKDFKWTGKFDGVPCKVTSYNLVWRPDDLEDVTVNIGVTAGGRKMTVEALFNPASGKDESLKVNGKEMAESQISTDLDIYLTKFAIAGWFRWEENDTPHEVYARGEHRYI